jgi:hypothetical protein
MIGAPSLIKEIFAKWDGTVVDLTPSIRQYFATSAAQGNFLAFQHIYIVQEKTFCMLLNLYIKIKMSKWPQKEPV